MRSPLRSTAVAALALLVLGLGVLLASCGKNSSLVTSPTPSAPEVAMGLRVSPGELQVAMRVQEENTADLLRTAGVVGTAITADLDGQPAIMILTESAMGGRLPALIGKYSVDETVDAAEHVVSIAREEHDVPVRLRDRTGQLLPVRHRLGGRFDECLTEGVWGVLQRAQAHHTMQIELIRIDRPDSHLRYHADP